MKKNIKTIFTSHWSYIFLCIIIIFIARLDIIELSNGFNFSFLKCRIGVVFFEMIFLIIPLIFLIFYFILTYFGLRIIKAPKWSYAVIFLLPGILLGAYSLYYDLPQVKAYGTLKAAGLAPLPESAYDLKTHDVDLFLRAYWILWFKASPADIKSFLEQSPVLKNAKYTNYSQEKIEWHNGMPSWYKLEIKKGEGRKYLYDHRGFGIQLLVDEKDNIVLVSVNWG